MKNKIKTILRAKNVVLYNSKEDKYYLSKKGVILVEDNKNNIRVLDLVSNEDITDNTDIEVNISKKRTKLKTIFEENKK